MPNGRHGDSPITDIILHDMVVFGDPIDGLVHYIHKSGQYARFSAEMSALLWDNWPHWEDRKPELEKVERRLRERKQEIESSRSS